MRGRLFITISDTCEVRQYAVNRVAGKVLIFLLQGHTLLFVLGFIGLGWLAWEIDALRYTRDVLVREYRMATDKNARQEYKARDELKSIEESINKKREELDIINEVGKATPDKAPPPAKNHLSWASPASLKTFGQFIPVGAPMEDASMSSGFGLRLHPILKRLLPHNGVDYDVASGTPVYVTAAGVVESAQNSRDGYGLMVIVRHPYNFRSFYAHLSHASVVPGQIVRKGDLIAESGNSGLSTGPHLHYEVHYDDRALDPAPFVQTAGEPSQLFQKTRSVPWASLVAYQQP
jgi:murein DD-endopeptidase MepM/ murein hydrolase activator NlpD